MVHPKLTSQVEPRRTGVTTLVTPPLEEKNVSAPQPLVLFTLSGVPPLLFLPRHETRSHSRTILVSHPSGVDRRTEISPTAFHSATVGGADLAWGISAGSPSGPRPPGPAGVGIDVGVAAVTVGPNRAGPGGIAVVTTGAAVLSPPLGLLED